jgi:CheY-like chemotaxis protein
MALILIVDDSSYQRRLVRKFVEVKDHQVIEATNGAEALELISMHNPDCILLDLIMPQTNGFELLESLQKQGSTIPAVVVTADVQTSTRQQCIDLGAAAVVNKPVDSETLHQTLDQILSFQDEETS